MIGFLALLGAKAPCYTEIEQDLNCNGIDHRDERAVDLTDPLCAAETDTFGNPWPNADYYIGYQSFGCR